MQTPTVKSISRLTQKIEQIELNEWEKYFSLRGTKTDCENISKIPRQTINNVLASGKGEVRVIKAIRKYLKSRLQPQLV